MSCSFKDSYGFIRGARESESELFHFVCRELKQYYSSFYRVRLLDKTFYVVMWFKDSILMFRLCFLVAHIDLMNYDDRRNKLGSQNKCFCTFAWLNINRDTYENENIDTTVPQLFSFQK